MKHSLSQRFSYIFTAVVTGIVLLFLTIMSVINLSRTEERLQDQLVRMAHLAETGLASAVWQLEPSSVDALLQILFTDKAIVYARVFSDGKVMALKIHPHFSEQEFSFFQHSRNFMTREVTIKKEGHNIGRFQLAISRQQIWQELLSDILVNTLLTLCILVAILITSFVMTKRYILSPLSNLYNFSTLIAHGRLDMPVLEQEQTMYQDELGDLARVFDAMRERLQDLLQHIKQAGELMQTSSDDIFMAVNQLAAALEQQSASVLETTVTMESLTTTSRQISRNTDTVASMAEQTRISAQKGVSMAEETIEKMEQIDITNTQFLQKSMALGERSEKIGDVIEIINDIADRTKLIAFNAALESVGTSETGGKRFNVVAIEIRRLADSIIDSTQEISSNILEIQQGIRELVLSSDVTTQRISEGAEQTKILADWLQEILEAAVHTTSEAKQIASASQEQQNASEQILLALKEISDSSQQFVNASNQASKSANEMKDLSKELYTMLNSFGKREEGETIINEALCHD